MGGVMIRATHPSIGIHRDVPASVYHGWRETEYGLPVMSKSRLEPMAHSPRYWKWRDDTPRESTDSMALGSALDDYLLDPDAFASGWRIGGKSVGETKRTKGWRDFVTECEADNVQPLHPKDWPTILAMAESVHACEDARSLLLSDKAERQVSLVAEGPSGVLLKGRPDAMLPEMGIIADLKTTRAPEPQYTLKDGLPYWPDVRKYGYHRQAALYCDLASQLYGREFSEFYFVAVGNEPPSDVVIYQVGPELLNEGRESYRAMLARWVQCHESDHWPGAAESVVVL